MNFIHIWDMIDWLNDIDRDLFFFLNGLHAEWLDQPMFWLSGKWIWIPLYLILIYLIFKHFMPKKALVYLIFALVSVGISDYICSGFLKPTIKRYRPSRDVELAEKVHVVNDYRGGRYGFASSHASNSFAVAVFFFVFFRKRHRWIWILLLWATVVSYTRIYLGVHYPGDILVGAIIGSIVGATCAAIAQRLYRGL